jgi:hypothetical protein
MKVNILMMSAAALAFAPANALAAPTGHGPDHSNGPATTGQPNQSCEDLEAGGNDVRPGNAESAPGSAFNPDGNAGTHYAGEQPQNSRNSASVSQYDVACLHQPQ